MREKELRIALVCYGGISLAVYMHGVTKELWKLLKASRANRGSHGESSSGTEAVYERLLRRIESDHGLRLRVLSDIIAGASAGGINSVFLAQAIHSGQSLEPLTELWLKDADVDELLDPDARPLSRATKFWAAPIVSFLLSSRAGNLVSQSVAPETRKEVREKLSRLIRSRWFEAPFGGLGFSRMLLRAFSAMQAAPAAAPLLPPGHPLDLFVTATDFKGHLETLHLNSPPLVEESEHRISLSFRGYPPAAAGQSLASLYELVFAARATASFPGAFPALQISEIDALAAENGANWDTREAFLKRVMPEHHQRKDIGGVALIDGSVLVNAPFEDAMSVLRDRPALREVDRRFVYIDPRPDRIGGIRRGDARAPGFFSVIFGSLSSIPREQPIRDNLEDLERQSNEMATLRAVVRAVQPEVEETVERLFGRTLFLDHPSPRRLASWRAKAQDAACVQAGFAYHGYAHVKLAGIISSLARLIHSASPDIVFASHEPVARRLHAYLATIGLDHLTAPRGNATPEAIAFFRAHDREFRERRLRFLARRLTQDWEPDGKISEADRDAAREAVYASLALYLASSQPETLGDEFPDMAKRVFTEPELVLSHIAGRRALPEIDTRVDAMLAEAMVAMPLDLRRPMLLAYLGFPFYDAVTLPMLRGEGASEFDAVKVDRISPDDATSIRGGGAQATLRGVEFYNFGAFFSRTYRENDYLWGRLHGAERMIDLIASALPQEEAISPDRLANFKREAFLAILEEEEGRLTADRGLVPGLRHEVLGRTNAD